METVLLSLGIALTIGLIMSRIVKLVGLPTVTGYLIGGILVGPYCLGRLGIHGLGFTTAEEVGSLKVISELALGFIAFSIGNEFRLSQLRKTGKQALIIGIAQAVITTLFVDVVLIGVYLVFLRDTLSLASAITLGAIASATAPAATLMVVHQYEAKGRLVDLLLPVVALDDAVGLVLFAVSFGIAKALNGGHFSVGAIVFEPILEILVSLLLGAIIGTLLTISEKFFLSRAKRLSVVVTAIILTVAISMYKFNVFGLSFSVSSLLVCMMLGTMFCNESEYEFSTNLMERTDRWATPLLIAFFVISGAELELGVFSKLSVVLVGVIFIISRSIGKYFGAYFSAKGVKCDRDIYRNLGITLLPQAGVAIGMCLKAQELGEDGHLIRNVILFAVLIYELIGPYLTKRALVRTGDIKKENLNK